MSLRYHIVCRDCRSDVWVGQNKRLYSDIEDMETFLFAHYMHTLAFMETNDLTDLKQLWEH